VLLEEGQRWRYASLEEGVVVGRREGYWPKWWTGGQWSEVGKGYPIHHVRGSLTNPIPA